MKQMDRDKLKLIIRNMELLVDGLKAEVYSDISSYKTQENKVSSITDYDELYDDEDGYVD
jgi:hypothetical protein